MAEWSEPVAEILYDTAAVARMLSITEGTLRKWRITGAGPRFLRLGRSVRYSAADLEAFTRSRSFRSTASADAALDCLEAV